MQRLGQPIAALLGVLMLQLALGAGLACADAAPPQGAVSARAAHAPFMEGVHDLAAHDRTDDESAACTAAVTDQRCNDSHGVAMSCMMPGACSSPVVPPDGAGEPFDAGAMDGELPVLHALRSVAAASPELPPPRA